MVYCSRADAPNSSSKKKNTDERKALDTFRQEVQNRKIRNNKSYQCDFINSKTPDIVRIITVNPKHTNICQPFSNQWTISKTKARDCAKLSLCSMQDIMNLIDVHQHVPSKILHPFVKKILPGRKFISSIDIANIRVRARVFLKSERRAKQLITINFNLKR